MAEFAFPTNAPAPDASVFKAEPEFANLTEKQEQSLAALPAALEALGITGEELSREERCSFLKVKCFQPLMIRSSFDMCKPFVTADLYRFIRR